MLARVAAPQRVRRIDLDAREKLERPLVRLDWPALTAFGIASLFHQKQRGMKVAMMIDQNEDRLERRRAPPSKLVLDYGGFSSDMQSRPAGNDGLQQAKHHRSKERSPTNLWVCGRMQHSVGNSV